MQELKKWKIFLSSTSKDLSKMRKRITVFLRNQDFDVIRYEDNFIKHVNKNAQDICVDNVRTADFFVLLLDKMYGTSFRNDESISITQAEYLEAKTCGIPIIFFLNEELNNEYRNVIRELVNLGESPNTATLSKQLELSKLTYVAEPKLLLFVYELMTSEAGNYASFFKNYKDLESELLNRLKDFSFSIFDKLLHKQQDSLRYRNEFWRTLDEILNIYYIAPDIKKIPDDGIRYIDLSKAVFFMLNKEQLVTIQGKAGAGKSTEIVRTYLDDNIDKKNYIHKMKLFVRLKDIPIKIFNNFSPISILNYQIETMLSKKPYKYFYDDIKYHLYFDGLDEIADSPIESDIKFYLTPEILKHNLVISSRIETSDRMKNYLSKQSVFPIVYEICEWNQKKATEFLSKVFTNSPALIEKINDTESQKKIISIIQNPLIATMFVFIIHENNLEFPTDIENRASLFERFVDRWLDRELSRISVGKTQYSKLKKEIRMAWRIAAWELYKARGLNMKLNISQIIEKIKLKYPRITKKSLNGSVFKSLLFENMATSDITGFVHEQFMEYFIAELFVEYSLNIDNYFLQYLEKSILGDVNGFVKAIWDKFEDSKLLKIFKNLQSVFYNSKISIQMQANIIYYISRIPLIDSFLIKKFFNDVSRTAPHIYVRNGALFSLVRLGDLTAEERLYEALTTNEDAASYNRRLHLEYFSDLLPEGTPPVFDNGKSDWSKCCQKLLEHIYDNSERFIFTRRIDIFTIRNLMFSRQRRGSLDKESLELIHSSLYEMKKCSTKYLELIDKSITEYILLKELWESLPV